MRSIRGEYLDHLIVVTDRGAEHSFVNQRERLRQPPDTGLPRRFGSAPMSLAFHHETGRRSQARVSSSLTRIRLRGPFLRCAPVKLPTGTLDRIGGAFMSDVLAVPHLLPVGRTPEDSRIVGTSFLLNIGCLKVCSDVGDLNRRKVHLRQPGNPVTSYDLYLFVDELFLRLRFRALRSGVLG